MVISQVKLYGNGISDFAWFMTLMNVGNVARILLMFTTAQHGI